MATNKSTEIDPSCGTTGSNISIAHFRPQNGPTRLRPAEKIIADTLKRIRQGQQQVLLSMDEVKNELQTSLALTKSRIRNSEELLKRKQERSKPCIYNERLRNLCKLIEEDDTEAKEDVISESTVNLCGPQMRENYIKFKKSQGNMSESQEQNNNPGLFPQTATGTVPPKARPPDIEMKVKLSNFKLPINQQVIVFVNEIKYGGIEESEQICSYPVSIIQRKTDSIDSSTSPYFESSDLSDIRSSSQLDSGSSNSATSNYYTTSSSSSFTSCSSAESGSGNSNKSPSFVQRQQVLSKAPASGILRVRDESKGIHEKASIESLTNEPPCATKKKSKKGLHVTFKMDSESEMSLNEQPVNSNTPEMKPNDCASGSKKGLYEFMRPVCGQINEMENADVALQD